MCVVCVVTLIVVVIRMLLLLFIVFNNVYLAHLDALATLSPIHHGPSVCDQQKEAMLSTHPLRVT